MAPNGITGSPLRVVDHGYLGFGVGRSIEIRRVADDALAASLNGMAAVRSDSMAYANLFAAAPELAEALEATQPLLQVAMLEAQKRGDGEFLSRLQTTFAANSAALAKARGEG